MIIGDPSIFAIESKITTAYDRLGFRALGFFVIHVGGRRYGVCEPDATMLACSFDAVEDRIARRGLHTAPFATEDAGAIADAFRNAIYGEERQDSYFGIPVNDFCDLFSRKSSALMWAPDGDEAFDDGSYVLQFDLDDRVRLIAFRRTPPDYRCDPGTLRDIWLPVTEYYEILSKWRDQFLTEWKDMPKTLEI